MIICGVKLTHDGGVALVDDGRLVFSVEMEKLGNNERYHQIDDLSVIVKLIRRYGYQPRDVDHFVIDGWRKTHKVKAWGGQEVAIDLAPYRRGLLDDALLRPYRFRTLDLEYTSYTHYAGHVAGAYCTSPFAAAGQPSYVLCWDGAMFPFLYHYDPATGRMESLGALFHMLGDTYHTLCQGYPPFDAPIEWPYTLGLPGKIMAYVAHGRPDDTAIGELRRRQHEAELAVLGSQEPPDEQLDERAGRRILDHMRQRLSVPGVDPADMLASIHAFLGETLTTRLAERIVRDGRCTENLCLVGGCALNIKWNRDIREAKVARRLWVPPFPNDAGSAIGAACCQLMQTPDTARLDWPTYAGPALAAAPVGAGWSGRPCSLEELAAWLHNTDAPVLFLHGRAELGPRALGRRSILAPAVSPTMRDRLNQLKGREGYRPIAPVCLRDRAPEVFSPGTPDPYMLFDHDVRTPWRTRVPAICHVDHTARVQTVGPDDDSALFELLTAYERLSGVPLLCNTSANRHGRGFFPDLRSATEWGRVPAAWSDGHVLRKGVITADVCQCLAGCRAGQCRRAGQPEPDRAQAAPIR